MANILLVEPDYRSKFPPLGLLRLSSYHKEKGDCVTFARGKVPSLRERSWHRVYVSSLFTWELDRTIQTVKYYSQTVENSDDIIVGGIGATLRPDYVRNGVACRVVVGQLDRRGCVDRDTPPISDYIPDYALLKDAERPYRPSNAYFCRATVGCVRTCKFCAVPTLEPEYRVLKNWRSQIGRVRRAFGEQQDLVILDNNILACSDFERIVSDIRDEGFIPGAKFNKRQRVVDFNQGIDARLVTKLNAKLLASICLSPVRLAFDHDVVEPAYRKAVGLLAEQGFDEFTNYVLFNYLDDPASLYRRLSVNLDLSEQHGIRVTGFPMRYVPINEVRRGYIAPKWHWRYIRGIQCVLLATHGIISPRREFFNAAFGKTPGEFFEIICMPEHYIILRERFKTEANDWRKLFQKLGDATRAEFLDALATIHRSRDRKKVIHDYPQFRNLLDHYYKGGRPMRIWKKASKAKPAVGTHGDNAPETVSGARSGGSKSRSLPRLTPSPQES
jgi:hypothetical protein